MTFRLLGYEFLSPPQSTMWGDDLWRVKDGVDIKIDFPLCLDTGTWGFLEPDEVISVLSAYAARPLEKDMFDGNMFLKPEGADLLRWNEVPAAGVFPFVRFADDQDREAAVKRNSFRVAACVDYGIYNPQADSVFTPVGYDIANASLTYSGLTFWGGDKVLAWRKQYAKGLNRWHLFSDFALAREAATALTEIVASPETHSLFAVGVGLHKSVLASLDSLRL